MTSPLPSRRNTTAVLAFADTWRKPIRSASACVQAAPAHAEIVRGKITRYTLINSRRADPGASAARGYRLHPIGDGTSDRIRKLVHEALNQPDVTGGLLKGWFARAGAELERLSPEVRKNLRVKAGLIVAADYGPLPVDMGAVSDEWRAVYEGVVQVVAERLHSDRGLDEPLRGTRELSSWLATQLAAELGARPRTGEAPPGGSRPPVDPMEIGGGGGPSGLSEAAAPSEAPADPPEYVDPPTYGSAVPSYVHSAISAEGLGENAEHWINAVAQRLWLFPEQARPLLQYSWFKPVSFERILRQIADVPENASELAHSAAQTGRIVSEYLAEVANHLIPMSARDVLEVSEALKIRPRYLLLFGDELRMIYSQPGEFDRPSVVQTVFQATYAPTGGIPAFVNRTLGQVAGAPEDASQLAGLVAQILRIPDYEQRVADQLTPTVERDVYKVSERDVSEMSNALNLHSLYLLLFGDELREIYSRKGNFDRLMAARTALQRKSAPAGGIQAFVNRASSQAFYLRGNASELANLVAQIRRIPDDMQEVAGQLTPMSARDVYDVSRALGIDPANLPIFGNELREIYSRPEEFERPEVALAALQDKYAPNGKISDFAVAAGRAEISAEEMRRVLQAQGNNELTPGDLLRMPLEDLLERVQAALAANPGNDAPSTDAEQAIRIVHQQMLGELPVSQPGAVEPISEPGAEGRSRRVSLGKVPDAWFQDVVEQVENILSRDDADYDHRLRWAAGRARRLVDLRRNGADLTNRGPAAGSSTGPGTIANEWAAAADSEVQSANQVASINADEVSRVSQVLSIEPRDLWVFSDQLRGIYSRVHVEGFDPLNEVRSLLADYAADIPAFVSVAVRVGINAEDMFAVLDSAHREEGITLDDLTRMPSDQLVHLARGELSRLAEVADQFQPMRASDVSRVSRGFGLEPHDLWIFGDQLREIYSRSSEEGFDPLDEVRTLFHGYATNISAFVSAAVRAGITAEDLHAILAPLAPMSLDDIFQVINHYGIELRQMRVFHSQLPAIYARTPEEGFDPWRAVQNLFASYAEDIPTFTSVAFRAQVHAEELSMALNSLGARGSEWALEDLQEAPSEYLSQLVDAELSQLREVAERLSPMSMNDVYRVSHAFEIAPQDLWVFGDELREIYSRSSEENFDPLNDVERLLDDYGEAFQDPDFDILDFLKVAVDAHVHAADMLAVLRLAAELLEPMSVGDVFRVSHAFDINPRDLWVFGDGLRKIYSRPPEDGFAHQDEVERLLARYAAREDIRDFAEIAARAGLDAERMHAIVDSAQRNQRLSLGDLRRMDRDSLLDFLPLVRTRRRADDMLSDERSVQEPEPAHDEEPVARPAKRMRRDRDMNVPMQPSAEGGPSTRREALVEQTGGHDGVRREMSVDVSPDALLPISDDMDVDPAADVSSTPHVDLPGPGSIGPEPYRTGSDQQRVTAVRPSSVPGESFQHPASTGPVPSTRPPAVSLAQQQTAHRYGVELTDQPHNLLEAVRTSSPGLALEPARAQTILHRQDLSADDPTHLAQAFNLQITIIDPTGNPSTYGTGPTPVVIATTNTGTYLPSHHRTTTTPSNTDTPTSRNDGHNGNSGGHLTQVRHATTNAPMRTGLNTAINQLQKKIRETLTKAGLPTDEATLETAYTNHDYLQTLQTALAGWNGNHKPRRHTTHDPQTGISWSTSRHSAYKNGKPIQNPACVSIAVLTLNMEGSDAPMDVKRDCLKDRGRVGDPAGWS